MNVEFEVLNVRKLKRFLDSEIGTEYEAINNKFDWGGSVIVYDITINENKKIKNYINNNNLLNN